jgi:hypothetical protein
MHDGQNLFDPRYAFGGRTWQVPQTLDAGIDALDPDGHGLPEVVVIGPENTARRVYEYTPSKSSEPSYQRQWWRRPVSALSRRRADAADVQPGGAGQAQRVDC